MKKFYLALFLCAFITNLFAQEGTLTTITAHESTDMNWYGAFLQSADFPDEDKTYQSIKMHVQLGCHSVDGCSDWDYTVYFRLLEPTGVMDSTVAELDTISTDPLQVDTIWNVFETKEKFELGRLITPYGGYMANSQNGFTNDWTRTFEYDVTDYASLLKGTKELESFYSGWSTGFNVVIWFDFIEGTPPRNVVSIDNIYSGGQFSSTDYFNNTILAEKDLTKPAEATMAKMRITTSGHGADDTEGCGEFCKKKYYLRVNDQLVGSPEMWRDDCSVNPLQPQGGTWIYSRADWCPGDKIFWRDFEITNFWGDENDYTLDMDFDAINWSGNSAPSYGISAQLFTYSSYNFENDVAMVDILAPTANDQHARFNPICGKPLIEVRNTGGNTVTSIDFKYYTVPENNACTYTWTGILPSMGTAQIELPAMKWSGEQDNIFEVEITGVNGGDDAYATNNKMSSTFEMPAVYDVSSLILTLNTNNRANENGYSIIDSEGNVVYSKNQGSLSNNTNYNDEFVLSEGCYEFVLTDIAGYNTADAQYGSGNGLYFWAHSNFQTAGSVSLRNGDNGGTIKTFNSDFGGEIRFQFVIGQTISAANNAACGATVTSIKAIENLSFLSYYPNPVNDILTVEMEMRESATVQLALFDNTGRLLRNQQLEEGKYLETRFDIYDLPKGVYTLRITTEGQSIAKQIVKQ